MRSYVYLDEDGNSGWHQNQDARLLLEKIGENDGLTDSSPNDLMNKKACFKFLVALNSELAINLLVLTEIPMVVLRLRQKEMSFLKAKNSKSNYKPRITVIL